MCIHDYFFRVMPNRQADWSTRLDSGGGAAPLRLGWMAWSAPISWIVLRPLIASMATLALNSGLWVRRLLNSFGEGFAYGGTPFRGGAPPQRLTMGAVQKSQTTSLLNLGGFESLIHDKDARNHPSVRQPRH
jgi:hypothetical protein